MQYDRRKKQYPGNPGMFIDLHLPPDFSAANYLPMFWINSRALILSARASRLTGLGT